MAFLFLPSHGQQVFECLLNIWQTSFFFFPRATDACFPDPLRSRRRLRRLRKGRDRGGSRRGRGRLGARRRRGRMGVSITFHTTPVTRLLLFEHPQL
jgi:hypothetical protein